MPTDANTLRALLGPLAAQAEGLQAPALPAQPDPLPEAQVAAWRRVVASFALTEANEGRALAPVAQGLASAGLAFPEVLAFFDGQGRDEHRHAEAFAAYHQHAFGVRPGKPSSAASAWVFEQLIALAERTAATRPLRVLLPLLVLERATVAYVGQLRRAAQGQPGLLALLDAVMKDEARHVAGVGFACQALAAAQPPSRMERLVLAAMTKAIALDMKRQAWWKPSLKGHMAALGVDVVAVDAAINRSYREAMALVDRPLEARPEAAPEAQAPAAVAPLEAASPAGWPSAAERPSPSAEVLAAAPVRTGT